MNSGKTAYCNRIKNNQAFTLTELLVVVILVGILASLAIPRFGKSTNKAMETEAKLALLQVQELQKVYYLEFRTFSNDLDDIDFEQETTVKEDPKEGKARYQIAMVSANDEDFLAEAIPLVKGLRKYTISKKGNPVKE